jgi:hypothetical protein
MTDKVNIPEIDREWYQGTWLLDQEQRALNLAYYVSWPQHLTIAAKIEHACGTTHCVAGKIAADLDERYANDTEVDGVHVAEFAANALGIDFEDNASPGGLFWGGNDAVDVRRIAESLAGERL